MLWLHLKWMNLSSIMIAFSSSRYRMHQHNLCERLHEMPPWGMSHKGIHRSLTREAPDLAVSSLTFSCGLWVPGWLCPLGSCVRSPVIWRFSLLSDLQSLSLSVLFASKSSCTEEQQLVLAWDIETGQWGWVIVIF